MFPFTEKQLKILEAEGPLIIVGGPGSGKTTVSIYKAALIIGSKIRADQRMLFLSFSRPAVFRVLEAIRENSDIEPEIKKRIDVETYHSFFWKVLKSHGYLIGLPRKLTVIASSDEAVALAAIRSQFGRDMSDEKKKERAKLEYEELNRLAYAEGKICFSFFSILVSHILTKSIKIRQLIANRFPYIILDEFQDTDEQQWSIVKALGTETTLIALADPEQRIYDFLSTHPQRVQHFESEFTPTRFDLASSNHRSAGTDIAVFGNDVLGGKFRSEPYVGVQLSPFPGNDNQAYSQLKIATIKSIKRLIPIGKGKWSLAILVPTKKLMRLVSERFRLVEALPTISHTAFIDMEGVILSAEMIAFLLQPQFGFNEEQTFVELLCNFFKGKGGNGPSMTNLKIAENIHNQFQKSLDKIKSGNPLTGKSILVAIHQGYLRTKAYQRTGNPDTDWKEIRNILENSGCPKLRMVADEAKNVRLLDRGTQLRTALALNWREEGGYTNALEIVRQAFLNEHFSASNRPETGVFVMNMHKAKGKQFDEVIIFEGWPKGEYNGDRIVRGNDRSQNLSSARQNLRVSVTRAKSMVTILTPVNDPCVLLG